MTGPISGRSTPLVLVVDDEEDILELVKYNLKKEGFDVHCAENGVEALQMAKESIPDVVVMDIMMPEMNGIDLLRALKSEPKIQEIPVIMLTSHHDVTKLQEALSLGAHDYVVKPCEPTELIARLQAAYKLSQAQSELKKAHVKLNSAYRVIKREMEDIGHLQRILLPMEDAFEGNSFALESFYQPCMDSGGDFYDVVRISDKESVFAIGDVSGHGAKATVIMAVLKSLFTEYVHEVDSPDELLNILNKKLIQCLPVQAFITFFLGKINWETGRFVDASAGHEKPFWYSSMSASVIQLQTDSGYPLLLDGQSDFSLHEVNMVSDDRILFYTDGLYDMINREGVRLGFDNFVAVMEEILPMDRGVYSDSIKNFFENFSTGAKQPDDITYYTVFIK